MGDPKLKGFGLEVLPPPTPPVLKGFGLEVLPPPTPPILKGFGLESAGRFEAIDFSADKTQVQVGEDIQFTAIPVGEIISFLWDFGDSETSTLQNPIHDYDVPGLFTVSLTFTSFESIPVEIKVGFITVTPRNVTEVAVTLPGGIGADLPEKNILAVKDFATVNVQTGVTKVDVEI